MSEAMQYAPIPEPRVQGDAAKRGLRAVKDVSAQMSEEQIAQAEKEATALAFLMRSYKRIPARYESEVGFSRQVEISNWNDLSPADRAALVTLEGSIFVDSEYFSEDDYVSIDVGNGAYARCLEKYARYNHFSTFIFVRNGDQIVGGMRVVEFSQAHNTPTLEDRYKFEIPADQIERWYRSKDQVQDIATLFLDRDYRGKLEYTLAMYREARRRAYERGVTIWTMISDERVHMMLTGLYHFDVYPLGVAKMEYGSMTYPEGLNPLTQVARVEKYAARLKENGIKNYDGYLKLAEALRVPQYESGSEQSYEY